MRPKLVAGNWKMNGTRAEVKTLIAGVKAGMENVSKTTEVAVFPSFLNLDYVHHELKDTNILLGAQNFYPKASGAFTGEVSGTMLKEAGCQLVLVGHSERRQLFHEDLACIAEKFKTAETFQLKPILCIGETHQERLANKTEAVLREQLVSVIDTAGIDHFKDAIIAYEPVWAIGTGLTATPEQAEAAHAFIRSVLASYKNDIANRTQILYGGSVKADNAAGLFKMPNIDGALVGGASLEAKSFLAIIEAAE